MQDDGWTLVSDRHSIKSYSQPGSDGTSVRIKVEGDIEASPLEQVDNKVEEKEDEGEIIRAHTVYTALLAACWGRVGMDEVRITSLLRDIAVAGDSGGRGMQ